MLPKKKRPDSSLSACARTEGGPFEHSEKAAIYKPQDKLSPGAESVCQHLDLRLPGLQKCKE